MGRLGDNGAVWVILGFNTMSVGGFILGIAFYTYLRQELRLYRKSEETEDLGYLIFFYGLGLCALLGSFLTLKTKSVGKGSRKQVVMCQGVMNLLLVGLMAFAGYAIWDNIKPDQDFEKYCTPSQTNDIKFPCASLYHNWVTILTALAVSIICQIAFCVECVGYHFVYKQNQNSYSIQDISQEPDDDNEMLVPIDNVSDHDKYLKSTLVINPFKEAGFS